MNLKTYRKFNIRINRQNSESKKKNQVTHKNMNKNLKEYLFLSVGAELIFL